MDRFQQLAPREQLVLGVGTVLAVLIIGWSFGWSPLRDSTDALDASVAERSRQVVDLQRAANLSTSIPPESLSSATQSLIVLVDETAQPLGLASTFTRSTPDGADAISVSFRNAGFDRLIGWLIELEQAHGVAVVSVSFSRTENPGLVTGQVRLDRS